MGSKDEKHKPMDVLTKDGDLNIEQSISPWAPILIIVPPSIVENWSNEVSFLDKKVVFNAYFLSFVSYRCLFINFDLA